MEVLGTASHAEFNNFYTSTTRELPSKGSETAREGGDDFCNKSQGNVGPIPEQSWVESAERTPRTNVLYAEETTEKNAKDERDQYHIQYLMTKLPVLAEQFHVHRKVGEGTFSSVFLGTLRNLDPNSKHIPRQFAIKHLVPTSLPSRTERELQCLQDIGGSDNVIGIDLCLRQDDCVVFIMPYLPHKRFSDYVQDMSIAETRNYMLNLFIALRRVHSFNIIHRDIKPSNFLYDRENKKFLLVDFGLAQCVTTDLPMTDTHSEPTLCPQKRKREEEDKSLSSSKCMDTPVIQKRKRLALQPRTNESNIANISKNDTPHSYSFSEATGSNRKCGPENDIHKLGLSPSRNKVLHTKNENTPPHSRKTPRHKVLQNEGIRSPLQDGDISMKHNTIKKKLFPAGSPKISSGTHLDGPKFQTLAPQTPNGPSFVRVQNSQVKSHLVNPPLSSQHQQQQKKLVFSKPSPVTQVHSKMPMTRQCHCYGKPRVCSVCMARKVQAAPRAGTPGFRPPEVLLKYPLQTTAVDMWAAGIILLCILSGCYPFFRSPDDLSALAEIMTLFGTERIKKLAVKLGRLVTCSVEKKAMNLRKLCERLRRHRKAGRPGIPPGTPVCSECMQVIDELNGCLCLSPSDSYESPQSSNNNNCDLEMEYPSSAYHLLERLLDLNPETRITASEALEHPFVKGW
ncbi:cell division cycle 7-related protein kinase [Cryptotermes secundus]|uniref:cell division cycle 7-related protein kinase n=1 Tax=Cryptotermes secundus TaxID=105785 RepID=UPI000CD7C44F|nr:cell division cycle 7-related protein kinase [Cryptotermes secundus]